MMKEQGNALFLILIAVALFAALSYAVTQSGGGGGTIDKEKNVLTLARMVEYSGSLKQTAMRMILTGTNVSNLAFYSANPVRCSSGEDCIFAPEGGNANYEKPPSEIWSTGSQAWSFDNFPISNIGTSVADKTMRLGAASNCIKKNMCEQINKGLGLSISPIGNQTSLLGPNNSYPGKETACHDIVNSGCYWYYSVIVAQ